MLMSETVHYYHPKGLLITFCGSYIPVASPESVEVTCESESVDCPQCLEAMEYSVTQALGRVECVGCGHDLGFHSPVMGCVRRGTRFQLTCKCPGFV